MQLHIAIDLPLATLSVHVPLCCPVLVCCVQDFIRAGMTCIKFFIGFAGRRTTIRDLYSRLHYLNTAQRHFQSALDAKQRVRGRPTGGRGRGYHHRSDDFMASIKNMSVTDLEGHISTIALQMKVGSTNPHITVSGTAPLTPLTPYFSPLTPLTPYFSPPDPYDPTDPLFQGTIQRFH